MPDVKLREKFKQATVNASAGLLSRVPRFGLKLAIKGVRAKLVRYYEKNPENLSERKLRYLRGWALKMCDVFIYHYGKFAPEVRYKLIRNLGQNALMGAEAKRQAFKEKEGFLPPSATVISPTMRCNLACTGCYAFDYNKTKEGDISYDDIIKVIEEARDMGQAFIVITGGEPWLRKDDLLKIFAKYDDMYFITYTNGQLIDKDLAVKLAKLGNVAPCISVEGYKTQTDERRGAGVHEKVLAAMKNLREAGVPFAISVTTTRKNAELVTSDEFMDFYIKQGAVFAWYFQYMPIGREPNLDLLVTPEQRNLCRRRVREWRESDKPILCADFWGDAYLSDGCIAAGIAYLHVSGTGWIEPCVFTHLAVHNIKDTTLKEALRSKFFKAYREKQGKIKDRFLPCGIIDHPENLRKAVEEARQAGEDVHGTHPGAESVIEELSPEIEKMAEERKEVVGKAWKNGEL